jgi:hypothetical protein
MFDVGSPWPFSLIEDNSSQCVVDYFLLCAQKFQGYNVIPKFFNLLWPSTDQIKLGPGTLKTHCLRTLLDLLSTPSGSRAQLIAAAAPLEKNNNNHFSDQ